MAQLLKRPTVRWQKLQHSLWKNRWLWQTSLGVATLVISLRAFGLLQPPELIAYDHLFRLRPAEAQDDRIVIITIDDEDIKNTLKTGVIPDDRLAELLTRIRGYQPRAIGLDLYRNLPVGQGQAALEAVFTTTPNLIGIEKLKDPDNPEVEPSAVLKQNHQVGFNNVSIDADGVARRNLLFLKPDPNEKTHRSFALLLALKYLGAVTERTASGSIQINGVKFPAVNGNDGAYVDAEREGYAILANPRIPSFHKISITELLLAPVGSAADRNFAQTLQGRVVLIGSVAQSGRDFFSISTNRGLNGNAYQVSGVELQGQLISQILSAVEDGRSLIQVWTDPAEWLWILVWSAIGATVSWKIQAPKRAFLALFLAGSGLSAACYAAFLVGWWIPFVPPMLALAGSSVVITGHFAQMQAGLRKSKEFLQSIINTIPDPVFVKDQQHRWVVLNEAYCRFIGHPLETLLERSEFDFFSLEQAQHFWQQDDYTFSSRSQHESEEAFTDAQGTTYSMVTKRSLHRDAAGNLFLVGVMHDITRRKQMEVELRQNAAALERSKAELEQSNQELEQARDTLARMVYFDALTNLPNRKSFQEKLEETLDIAKTNDSLVGLLFIDLDGFKLVNDTYGHQMGDLLLKAVAQRLLRCLRNSDMVARLGGDEFVAILPNIPSAQDICKVAEKILTTLSQSFAFDGKIMMISASVGISIYPTDSGEISDLIRKADTAMYRAKNLGKNRYEFFHSIQALMPPKPTVPPNVSLSDTNVS
ncbi:MAG: diguanylate cyclase [Oculatellaceae cyanobacterium Prado106]|jgi:diguanylate cyclase (GGDEF)-like protein/PAS domain S-box-containing protein|nr:diguanylate cyclase [Oculatellaceae cyanobacterium Prado106]